MQPWLLAHVTGKDAISLLFGQRAARDISSAVLKTLFGDDSDFDFGTWRLLDVETGECVADLRSHLASSRTNVDQAHQSGLGQNTSKSEFETGLAFKV